MLYSVASICLITNATHLIKTGNSLEFKLPLIIRNYYNRRVNGLAHGNNV